jgi:hypothetical protein
MASNKQYQGDAAIHAAISILLLRGYNSGRPIYDEADSDDFWVRGPEGKILRCQARSATVKNWRKTRVDKVWMESRWSKSDTIQFPESVLTGGVDIVVMCILCEGQFYVGLFNPDDIKQMREEGRGGNTNRRTKDGKLSHRPTISFRWSIDFRARQPKFLYSGMMDVSNHFDQNGVKWNELFPLKWPSTTK